MENNPILNTIFNRKSVRKYTQVPPKNEQLELLVRAAMAAPTARNLQPWAFVIVTETELLKKLEDGLPYAKMLTQAGACIIVCGVPEKGFQELTDYWVQDCSAATQNILLAAEAINLGAVWTGVYPRPERIDVVKKTLNMPDNFIPLNLIVVGNPIGNEKVKDKFKPENIYRNKWQ